MEKMGKFVFLSIVTIILISIVDLYIYKSSAASGENYVIMDRAPRITFDRKNENKLIINVKDKGEIDTFKIEKYNETKKEYESVNLEANNIKIGSYNKITESKKVEIPKSFFPKENAHIKLRFTVTDDSRKNTLKEELQVKKLSKKNSSGNWYSINRAIRLSFTKNKYSTEKGALSNLKVTLKDKSGIKTLIVKDRNNDNKVIISEEYNGKNEEKTEKIDLTKFKATSDGLYKLTVETTSAGTKRIEQIAFCTNVAKAKAQKEALADKVVNKAKTYLGYKYKWGGTTPSGFDCSGFTSYVYKQAVGVTLSRTSSQQASNGKAVSKSNLNKADLLIFKGHVGIYIGNNKFIHAANKKKGVIISSLSESYYVKNYAGARRVL